MNHPHSFCRGEDNIHVLIYYSIHNVSSKRIQATTVPYVKSNSPLGRTEIKKNKGEGSWVVCVCTYWDIQRIKNLVPMGIYRSEDSYETALSIRDTKAI